MMILSWANIAYYQSLMAGMRDAIAEGRFASLQGRGEGGLGGRGSGTLAAPSRRSRHKIISPPATMNKAPGNSLSKGASAKNSQPSVKLKGMPKYSNGDRFDGWVER